MVRPKKMYTCALCLHSKLGYFLTFGEGWQRSKPSESHHIVIPRNSHPIPAMISLSLGSRLTVQGRNISTSLAVRTGVLEERKTSKLRMSPSISSSGSTSLVVGMLLEILQQKKENR